MTKNYTLRLTLSAVVIAILTLMAFVPQIGFISILPGGSVGINMLLIPVCVAAVVLGKYYGLAASAYMGILSLCMAFLRPNIYVEFFQNPLVSVLTRVPVGLAVYFAYSITGKLTRNSKKKYLREVLPVNIGASCGVILNTSLVSLSLFIFALAAPERADLIYTMMIPFPVNMAIELAAVNLVVPPITLALRKAGFDKILKKPAVRRETEAGNAAV